jgi:hypothetical protein
MADRMRFHDEVLQRKLVAVTAALGIEHWLEDGFLCTHERDTDAVSCLRDAVRCSLFPAGTSGGAAGPKTRACTTATGRTWRPTACAMSTWRKMGRGGSC